MRSRIFKNSRRASPVNQSSTCRWRAGKKFSSQRCSKPACLHFARTVRVLQYATYVCVRGCSNQSPSRAPRAATRGGAALQRCCSAEVVRLTRGGSCSAAARAACVSTWLGECTRRPVRISSCAHIRVLLV